VSVLVTTATIAAVALWALAVYRRLLHLRRQVTLAWQRLEPDQANEAIRTVYNKHVAIYNAALDAFPAYLIAPLAGLKPARRF
jgi:hypothetical protein